MVTLSGKTIDEVNALGDKEFASFAGDVLWGITSDALEFEYEGDNTLQMGLVMDPADASGISVRFLPALTESIIRTYAASPMRCEERLPRLPAAPRDGARRPTLKQEYERLRGLLATPAVRPQSRALAKVKLANRVLR